MGQQRVLGQRFGACQRWTVASIIGAVGGLLVLVLATMPAAASTPASTPSGGTSVGGAAADGDLASLEADVVALHNQARADAGLGHLRVLPLFTDTSRDWSAEMARRNTLMHQTTGNGYRSYVEVTCDASSASWTWCAENVAVGQLTAQAIHDAWMGSSGHRRNIMEPTATAIGIGAYRGSDGRIWWTARFMAADDLPPAGSAGSVQDRAFVDALHRVFAGRAATSAELDRWAGHLGAGGARSDVISALSTSDAWLGNEIDEIYDVALDRAPDSGGRSFWTRTVRAGTRITDLSVLVFASDEFYSRSGGTTDGFLDQLYRRVLGRRPSSAERSSAASAMARGASRSDVAGGVFATYESRAGRVEAAYRSVLGRGADSGGVSYWAEQLRTYDDVRLAAFLAGSEEFYQRAVAGA